MPARINVLVRSEESGGQLAVMDNVVRAGFPGPPLHHHAFDAALHVLDGEVTFELEGDRLTRGPGEPAFAPRGAVHAFANPVGRGQRAAGGVHRALVAYARGRLATGYAVKE